MQLHSDKHASLSHRQTTLRLRCLVLRNCPYMTNNGLAKISALLPRLLHLALQYCLTIADISIANISTSCRQLEHLNLTECERITNKGFQQIASLTNLVHLCLTGCTNVTDDSITSIASSLVRLRHFDVSYNEQVGMVTRLETIALLRHLVCLKLDSCPYISDVVMVSIGCLQFLRTLGMGCSSVTDVGLSCITSLQELRYFELTFNCVGH